MRNLSGKAGRGPQPTHVSYRTPFSRAADDNIPLAAEQAALGALEDGNSGKGKKCISGREGPARRKERPGGRAQVAKPLPERGLPQLVQSYFFKRRELFPDPLSDLFVVHCTAVFVAQVDDHGF